METLGCSQMYPCWKERKSLGRGGAGVSERRAKGVGVRVGLERRASFCLYPISQSSAEAG